LAQGERYKPARFSKGQSNPFLRAGTEVLRCDSGVCSRAFESRSRSGRAAELLIDEAARVVTVDGHAPLSILGEPDSESVYFQADPKSNFGVSTGSVNRVTGEASIHIITSTAGLCSLGDAGPPSVYSRRLSKVSVCMDWKCLVVALFLATSPAMAAETPIIFLNGGYDLTSARAACERVLSTDSGSAGAYECGLFPDLRGLGRNLETRVISALAVEPLCQCVKVLQDPDSEFDSLDFMSVQQANMALKNKNPYWSLHLEARPGSTAFGWTLFAYGAGPGSNIEAVVNGEGTAEKAGKDICVVVTRRGADVRRTR
jgi:hypothetical protein